MTIIFCQTRGLPAELCVFEFVFLCGCMMIVIALAALHVPHYELKVDVFSGFLSLSLKKSSFFLAAAQGS